MIGRLDVDREDVRARLGERLDVRLGVPHHQVAIEHGVGVGAQAGAGSCDSAAPALPMPTIEPDVVAAGPSAAPLVNSYVS